MTKWTTGRPKGRDGFPLKTFEPSNSSFWVPRLAGKTDLIPNHPNTMWIDPQETGLFLGQCSQYCGVQHAKMLLRVYAQSPEDFAAFLVQDAKLWERLVRESGAKAD